MKSLLAIGEILAEIMATEPGNGFLEPIELLSPCLSSAPRSIGVAKIRLLASERHLKS
jgi:hypothetical protein